MILVVKPAKRRGKAMKDKVKEIICFLLSNWEVFVWNIEVLERIVFG